MATQIKVNSATGNVTVQLSRTVIGTVVTANTANYANFAGVANTANNLNATTTANVVIGGGTNGYVLGTNGAGSLSWVEQTGGGGAGVPGGANTQVQYNNAGAFGGDAGFTYNDVTDTLTTGTISATNIGNITPTNLDGNTANYLDGTGTFAPVVAASATTAEQVIRLCKAAETITKGQAVTITGGTGDNPDVSLSDASSAILMPAIGIALENIAISALGNIALYGEVAGIDTTAFSVGDSIYISATNPGDVTDTAPKGETNLVQKVGKIVRSNANGIAMIQGAGRTNQTPNLDSGNIFLGDAFNQATTATLNTSIVPENTNLYYTDTRSRAALSTTTTAASSGGALAYDNGTGVFTYTPADVTGSTQSQIANGTSNVDIATVNGNVTVGVGGTANIAQFTPTGANIKTSLLVDGVSGNVLIQPNVAFDGKTYSSLIRGEFDTGTANSTTSQAFITDNYTTQGITAFQSFANTAAGQLASGPTFNFNNYAAIGNANTDPLVAGQIQFSANPDGANLAKADTGTGTSMTMGGQGVDGFLTVIGAGANDDAGTGAWRQFQYRPKAMEFVRRAGNADNRQSPVANDETSLNFFTTQTLSGNPGTIYQYPAKIGSKVDPGWTDPNNPAKATPSGLFFKVLSEDSANLEHRMYGNGTTTFNVASDSFGTPIATNPVSIGLDGTVTANAFTATTGNITATAGQFVGDGGGLSNIASANVTGLGNIATINIDGDAANILYGNGVFAPAGAAGIQSQIANGTSNVDIAASNGNVDITVSGNTSVIATDIGAIVQNEPLGNITISPGGAFGAGYVSNQYEPVSLKFFRRDGNSTNKVSPSANTETSFDFYTTQTNGGVPGSIYNYAAKMGSKVDPGWTDPNDPFKATPSGLFFKVVSEDSANLEHRMYANGTTTFNAFSQNFSGTPVSTNPVSIGLNGTVTANAFTATTGLFTGDGGGLSNVSATATPAGFFDSVQFNDNGSLGGDSVFTYSSSGKTLALNGTGGAPGPQSIANFNLRNGAFTVTQEEVGGGVATFNFKNFYSTNIIAPSTYFRARGTESAQTGVVAGDEILSEGYKVNAGGTGPTFLGVGSVSATVATNDGAGNVSMKYTIDTKQGSVFENDSVLLNTHRTDVSGNLRMTGNNETILTATRFRGQTNTFANLPTVGVTAGERAFITDLNTAFSFGSIVSTGGGSTFCPVFYDGTDWRQG